jgi:hypothetical protein
MFDQSTKFDGIVIKNIISIENCHNIQNFNDI